MTEPDEDFWPSSFVGILDDPAPVALLKKQASLLADKTGGTVEAVVQSTTIEGTIHYSLYFNAPILGANRYRVLSLDFPFERGPGDPFPVHVFNSVEHKDTSIKDMEEFRKWLKDALSSHLVGSLVATLKRQSEEMLATNRS